MEALWEEKRKGGQVVGRIDRQTKEMWEEKRLSVDQPVMFAALPFSVSPHCPAVFSPHMKMLPCSLSAPQ